MPKSGKKAATQENAYLVLSGKIHLMSSGFSATDDTNEVIELKWEDVETIGAWTRIRNGSRTLCLQFHRGYDSSGDESYVAVENTVIGWGKLKTALRKAFPGAAANWEKQATWEDDLELNDLAPDFVAEVTQVWKRKKR